MLKKKFTIITILTVMILALMIPIVRAENETSDEVSTNDDISLINEDMDEADVENILSEIDLREEDIYLTGDDVTIDYIVDGNLFVFANHVTINSQIGGDAFIFASTVTIGQNRLYL